jgi:hypothetical protein
MMINDGESFTTDLHHQHAVASKLGRPTFHMPTERHLEGSVLFRTSLEHPR